jgi:tetratricopeptide (TPR) repeat protein
MLIIISLIFFTLSLTGLVVVSYRHWPQLESLDIESLPETRDIQTKNSILEERLKRKLQTSSRAAWNFLRPVLVMIKKTTRQLYHLLLEKERTLREASEKIKFHKKAQSEQQEVISAKLEEEVATDNEQELEQKYLEILSLDPKNTAAYEGLAELYYDQKDFLHAREIYEHVMKLAGETIDHLVDVARCLRYEEQYKKAFKILEKALKLEPKNPKIIDKLVDVAIKMQDRVMAKNYLKLLRQVNPENKKLEDLKIRISKL